MLQDLRYGLRILARRPGFTAVAVITVALGIGANGAIFSVVSAVLLRPLPYEDPGRLVRVSSYGKADNQAPTVSGPDFWDYRERSRTFESFAGIRAATVTLSGDNVPETVDAAEVTSNFLSLLGVEPALGRHFTPEEDVPNGPRAAILSYGLWQRRFGADPRLLNTVVRIDEASYTVVGILPAAFKLYLPPDTYRLKNKAPDVWVTLRHDFLSKRRENNYLTVLGRIKPDVTLAEAAGEMDDIAAQLRAEHLSLQRIEYRIRLVPLQQRLVSEVRPLLIALLVAVGFLLLIACSNVANLFLVRATGRRKEFAIRAALGASRSRIVRQLLTESFLIVILGGGAGLLLAFWGLELLRYLRPANLPRLEAVAIDGRVLGYCLGACLLTTVMCGLAPALRLARPELRSAISEGGRQSSGRHIRGLRNVLVVTEIALSLILLVGGGLMIRTFAALQSVRPGFEPDNVLTFQINLPEARYGMRKNADFLRQLEERLTRLPGVEAAGATSQLPLTGRGFAADYATDEKAKLEGFSNLTAEADWRFITPGYLQATGTRLLEGRFFSEHDDFNSPKVVIIDDTLARKVWPDENAVGKRLLVSDSDGKRYQLAWMEVVGVIEPVRNQELTATGREQVYVPYAQTPIVFSMSFAVRAAGAPAGLSKAIEEEVQLLDKGLAIYNMRSMQSYIADVLAPVRFSLLLIGIFGAISLVLAMVGLYGVISYSVTQRTREIGIRLALGAQPRDVLKLTVGHGLVLSLMGIVIGATGAAGLMRLMASLLFGVSATDPLTFAGVSALLMVVTLLACYLPSRRAKKVDPVVALRCE